MVKFGEASLAPWWITFKAAYRNKSHIPKISVARVSAVSSSTKLCQKFTAQGTLPYVFITRAPCAHFHSKQHLSHLNVINCNKIYSTKDKEILQQKEDSSNKMNCRSPCQSNNFISLHLLVFPKTHWRQVQVLLCTFRGKRQTEALQVKLI